MTSKTDNPNDLTLVISDQASEKEVNTKNTIQKKLDKIEKLKKQSERLKDKILKIKKLYNIQIPKKQQILLQSKEKLIFKLFERFKQKSFTNWQKDLILDRLHNEIEFVENHGDLSDKMMELREELVAISSENLDDFEKELMNEMAKDFMAEMGIDIEDDDDFDITNMDPEEFKNRFEKEFHEQRAEHEQFEHFIKQEEKQQLTNKDFQKMYKDLVKKAHPDLVTDPEEKKIREEWMKQLSNIWEERNYYQLLLLNREISGTDTSNEMYLDTDLLKPLVHQLNQEINNLENEIYSIKNFDPESSYFYQNFNARSEKGITKKLDEFVEQMKLDNEEILDTLSRLKNQKSTKELLSEIRESMYYSQSDFFDFMDPFDL